MKIYTLIMLLLFGCQQHSMCQKHQQPAFTSVHKLTPATIQTTEREWFDEAKQTIINRSLSLCKTGAGATGVLLNQPIEFFITPASVKLSSSKNHWTSLIKVLSINGDDVEKANSQVLNNEYNAIFKQNRVQYINTAKGLKQNFIVQVPGSNPNTIYVDQQISGNLDVHVNDGKVKLQLNNSAKTVLEYDGLKVWDARGKILSSKFVKLPGKGIIRIMVDATNAQYPVTIDPLTHTPEWSSSANGVLPALLTNTQLQIDALHGYSVHGLGDVNADGYDDVAIGAPAAIDILNGTNTILGAGAVYVYFGSATGLPVQPSRVLRATTPIANALFGMSICAGNVAGDGKKEIIVGAPGDTYTANVSGLPAVATVTAGKVYVFRGEDIAIGEATPFYTSFLNGSTYFSNGVLNLALSNVNVNALYGYAVSTMGDVNSDGLDELVVGAPGYLGVSLLSVRIGAAFVTYSSSLASNTVTKLSAPSLLNFPLLQSLDGLLFGFSLDGAGDYNIDGRQDVIVGAPGGASLAGGNILGGSAYVFSGNAAGTGLNTNIAAQLVSSAGLIAGAANLFGYKVKGIRTAQGQRTGVVAISAPTGNVLSNVLSGLRLKAGRLEIFKPNAATGTITSQQTISSPRSTRLLSLLAGNTIDANMLFGVDVDNMQDVNCDGINDIIVGEPLSTAIGLIGTDAIGGAAYVFLGNADSSFRNTAFWTLENTVSYQLGVNAASLVGYSVAGAGRTYGAARGPRALIGAPGKMADFSTGLLQLGNTFNTLFNFVAVDNGIGKAYVYGFDCDAAEVLPDINATKVNVSVSGDVSINDPLPPGAVYGTPVPNANNNAGATLVVNSDGSYNFIAIDTGTYVYTIPVCIAPFGCLNQLLSINVHADAQHHPPLAKTDYAATMASQAVQIMSLANDASGILGIALDSGSVLIEVQPAHGIAIVNTTTGDITYTPQEGYTGMDTLTYRVFDKAEPLPYSANALQIINVKPDGHVNTTYAADDFAHVEKNATVAGQVLTNDTDPEGDMQQVFAQVTSIPGKGTLTLGVDGNYNFVPEVGYTGNVSFVYSIRDDNVMSDTASATLHILVTEQLHPDLTPTSRINNGTFSEAVLSQRNLVIEVNELFGNATRHALQPVRVRIFKSDNFSYNFDPSATSTTLPSLTAVNNPDWNLVENTNVMVFELKPGLNVNGFNTSRIYISLQVLNGAAPGTENFTITIQNGSGQEVIYSNNSVVRILNIVE